jgi:hypothetical protein
MTERPILFSGPMVRAILDGRKTQTRRVLTPQPNEQGLYDGISACHRALPWMVGDRLWVRERGAISASKQAFVHYVGNEPSLDAGRDSSIWPRSPDGTPYKPCVSIHMPRWASRLKLEVTDRKVERLQDISEADARAEGADPVHMQPGGQTGDPGDGWISYIEDFRRIWQTINGPGAWAANPWVVAISFRRVLP